MNEQTTTGGTQRVPAPGLERSKQNPLTRRSSPNHEPNHGPNHESTLEPIVELTDITKVYLMGKTRVEALRGISLAIRPGEYVAIIGASGSGKSTLMNIIGLLDRPTEGSYRIRGTEASKLGKNRMADLRNTEIGFIFQRFNLLARTSARRQVELPLFYAGLPSREASRRATAALERVGLGDRTHHRPDELSGGQQQRVAIARALVNEPSLLLADEPTGALDSKTGADILALFGELHRQGLTLIVVTHDMSVARQAERIVTIKDGLILSDAPSVPASRRETAPAHYTDAIGAQAIEPQEKDPLKTDEHTPVEVAVEPPETLLSESVHAAENGPKNTIQGGAQP